MELIRGSMPIPLSDDGVEEGEFVRDRVWAMGGVDSINCSDLVRAIQCAEIIADKRLPVRRVPALRTWCLGEYEGQPVDKVQPELDNLILNVPNFVIPGRGTDSTLPGESFNQFRDRVLGYETRRMREWISAGSAEKVMDVTHRYVIHLIMAWHRLGCPADLSVDRKFMVSGVNTIDTGSLWRWAPKQEGQWNFTKNRMRRNDPQLDPARWKVRHGETEYN